MPDRRPDSLVPDKNSGTWTRTARDCLDRSGPSPDLVQMVPGGTFIPGHVNAVRGSRGGGWAGGEVVGRHGPARLDAVGCGRSLAIVAVETMDVELAIGDVRNVIILEVEHALGMLDQGGGIRSNEKFNQLGDAVLGHECTRLGAHQLGTGGPCGGSQHSTGWRTSDR